MKEEREWSRGEGEGGVCIAGRLLRRRVEEEKKAKKSNAEPSFHQEVETQKPGETRKEKRMSRGKKQRGKQKV
jgi:hypothetical protein